MYDPDNYVLYVGKKRIEGYATMSSEEEERDRLHCHYELDGWPLKPCAWCKALEARSVDDRVKGTPAIESCAKCVSLELRLSKLIERVKELEFWDRRW